MTAIEESPWTPPTQADVARLERILQEQAEQLQALKDRETAKTGTELDPWNVTSTERPVRALAACQRGPKTNAKGRQFAGCPGYRQVPVDAVATITEWLIASGPASGKVEKTSELIRFKDEHDATCSHCGGPRVVSTQARPNYEPWQESDAYNIEQRAEDEERVRTAARPVGESPFTILQRRLALGEITAAEFTDLKDLVAPSESSEVFEEPYPEAAPPETVPESTDAANGNPRPPRDRRLPTSEPGVWKRVRADGTETFGYTLARRATGGFPDFRSASVAREQAIKLGIGGDDD